MTTDTSMLPAFQASVAQASNMVLIEGLPNENTEAKLFRSEKKNSETVKRHGFLFYPAALRPLPQDAATLAAALSAPNAISQYSRAMKQCGGFHPDFAVVWTDPQTAARNEAQICFGCEEIKFFGPDAKIYADLEPATFAALRSVLRHYGKRAVPR